MPRAAILWASPGRSGIPRFTAHTASNPCLLRSSRHRSTKTHFSSRFRLASLAFYGLAFQPGIYRTHAEPVDLAVTLASLLGINAPALATGGVLTEALQPSRHSTAPDAPPLSSPSPKSIHPLTPPDGEIQ